MEDQQEYAFPPLNPRQEELIQVIRDAAPGSTLILGFGGSMGGGKTHAIVRCVLYLAMAYPGSRILVGRAEFNKLKTTTLEEFDRFAPPSLVIRKNDTDHWREMRLQHWPPGVISKVFFRGLDNWSAFGSEEYTAIFIDEANDVSKNAAMMLITRLRKRLPKVVEERFKQIEEKTGKPQGLKYVFMAASNPYPGWFEEWFVRQTIKDPLEAVPNAMLRFIPSRIEDNRDNLPENYEEMQRAVLDPDLVARFIEGRFDAFMGQVYEGFKPIDVLKGGHKLYMPQSMFEGELDYERVIGGIDFGGVHPRAHYAAGIVAVLTKTGHLVRVAEFKDRGPDIADKQISWMSAQQARWCKQDTNPVIKWCADKSQMMAIMTWRRMGFDIVPSTGEPVWQGIARVKRWLLPHPGDGMPMSLYLPELVEWEREMLSYHYPEHSDKTDREMKMNPVKVNDDLVDADRYMHELVERYCGDPHQYARTLAVVQ